MCVLACVATGNRNSDWQCAVGKTAATCLTPVCHSQHTIVVKTLHFFLIPDPPVLRFYCPHGKGKKRVNSS